MKTCIACKEDVKDDATKCPHCGTSQSKAVQDAKACGMMALMAVIGIASLFLVIAMAQAKGLF